MSCTRRAYISKTEGFTETRDNPIFAISSVNIGEYNIVLLIFSEEIIEVSWYIVDVTGMRGFCYETLESFATSETDRTLSGDTASEESYAHVLLLFRRRIDDRSIHEFIDVVLFDVVTSFFPEIAIREGIEIDFRSEIESLEHSCHSFFVGIVGRILLKYFSK